MLDSHAESSAEILLERQRLARDLHDTVAQSLAALGYSLDEIVGDESITGASKRALRSNRLELSRIVAELRNEIHRLRSGLPATLYGWLSTRTRIRIEPDQGFRNLPEEPELGHLLLELLNNAEAHQGFTHATISFHNDVIATEFDGEGSKDARVRVDEMKFGKVGIRERLEILGASLESTDSGFKLSLGSANG